MVNGKNVHGKKVPGKKFAEKNVLTIGSLIILISNYVLHVTYIIYILSLTN